jgi:uncharacterized phiE125 gp8 family phage protein
MSWIVVTPPAEALVSTATVKGVLNVDHSLDDTLIAGLVASATAEAERISRRSLVTRTLRLALARWPLDGVILLDMPPVQSITSVQYYDADNVLQTVPSADYVAVLDVSPPYVRPAAGKSWPSDLREHSAVRVTYVAGYGTAAQVLAAVPEIVRIVQYEAAINYENRESITTNALAAKKRLEDKLESYCGWETP